jgi:hypothetical protein
MLFIITIAIITIIIIIIIITHTHARTHQQIEIRPCSRRCARASRLSCPTASIARPWHRGLYLWIAAAVWGDYR